MTLLPEICSVGQIWNTVCMTYHQSVSRNTKFKIDDSRARYISIRSNMDFCIDDLNSEGAYDYYIVHSYTKTYRLTTCSIGQIRTCMADVSSEGVNKIDDSRARNMFSMSNIDYFMADIYHQTDSISIYKKVQN